MNLSIRFSILGIAMLLIAGCSKKLQIRLADTLQNGNITVLNRQISQFPGDQSAIELNAQIGDGLAIVENLEFNEGEIHIEILGENNPGKSFVGFAFNIQNDSTYEVIYFRPFNFVASEKIRKDHMLQYIYHPEYPWHKLRAENTGEFEDEIINPPNPDLWFNAHIFIEKEKVSVFVNDAKEPSLVVRRLAPPMSKKIGLWTGHGSSGRFRNLKVIPAK